MNRTALALVLGLVASACFSGDATQHLWCRSDESCGEGQTCIIPPGEAWGQCDGPDPAAEPTDTETTGDPPVRETTGDATTGDTTLEPGTEGTGTEGTGTEGTGTEDAGTEGTGTG